MLQNFVLIQYVFTFVFGNGIMKHFRFLELGTFFRLKVIPKIKKNNCMYLTFKTHTIRIAQPFRQAGFLVLFLGGLEEIA